MKQRISGRVNGGFYEVVNPDGSMRYRAPLEQARNDAKLAAAIERNGWQGLPEA